MQLTTLDWVIVIVSLTLSFAPAIYLMRRAGSSTTEFFTSGRAAPWWLIGGSMVATTFSTDTPNLVTNLVREHGVANNWVWWAFLLTGMSTVFFYARMWRRSGVLTDLEFYEIRYSGKPEFSPRLRSYFALEEQDAGDEVGRVDFNIFTGTQDGTIANVKVEAKDVEQAKAPRKIIIATFTIEGVPTEIRYYFEKIGDRWFLDDISSPGDGKPDGMPPWTLSTVLKYGW